MKYITIYTHQWDTYVKSFNSESLWNLSIIITNVSIFIDKSDNNLKI